MFVLGHLQTHNALWTPLDTPNKQHVRLMSASMNAAKSTLFAAAALSNSSRDVADLSWLATHAMRASNTSTYDLPVVLIEAACRGAGGGDNEISYMENM